MHLLLPRCISILVQGRLTDHILTAASLWWSLRSINSVDIYSMVMADLSVTLLSNACLVLVSKVPMCNPGWPGNIRDVYMCLRCCAETDRNKYEVFYLMPRFSSICSGVQPSVTWLKSRVGVRYSETAQACDNPRSCKKLAMHVDRDAVTSGAH